MAVVEAVRIYARAAQYDLGLCIQDIRRVLQDADRAYFDEVGACETPLQALAVPYPLVPLEAVFEEAVARGWTRAQKEVQSALRRGWRVLSALHPSRVWTHQSVEDEALGFALVGEDLVIPEESIERYVATRVPPLRHVLSEVRRELCRDLVAEAVREGMTTSQTMMHLATEGFGRSTNHRETIARTESATLYNHGSLARYRASAVVQGVQVAAVGDNRTCERCMYMDGRCFRCDDMDGVSLPLHFGCRCVLTPILFNEEVEFETAAEVLAGATEDERPLSGFGAVDYSTMPEPRDLRDFLRPLSESDKAEMREWVERVKAKYGL